MLLVKRQDLTRTPMEILDSIQEHEKVIKTSLGKLKKLLN